MEKSIDIISHIHTSTIIVSVSKSYESKAFKGKFIEEDCIQNLCMNTIGYYIEGLFSIYGLNQSSDVTVEIEMTEETIQTFKNMIKNTIEILNPAVQPKIYYEAQFSEDMNPDFNYIRFCVK